MGSLEFDIAPSAGHHGAGAELRAAVPAPHLRRAQDLRAAGQPAGGGRGLAGLRAGRAASLHHGRHRARSSRRSPFRSPCITSSVGCSIHRSVETVLGVGLTMIIGRRAGGAVDPAGAAGDLSSGAHHAREPGAGALGRAARPADDDHPAQRGDPGGRLHVAGERPHPGRGRRARHAAGGGDERRLLGAWSPSSSSASSSSTSASASTPSTCTISRPSGASANEPARSSSCARRLAAGVILGFIPGRYHRSAARLNVLAVVRHAGVAA